MADHGTPEYATATGNDYAAHQGTYKFFVKLTLIGSLALAALMVALAIGGVNGHWGLFSLGTLAILVSAFVGLASETARPAPLGGVLVVLLLLLVVTS